MSVSACQAWGLQADLEPQVPTLWINAYVSVGLPAFTANSTAVFVTSLPAMLNTQHRQDPLWMIPLGLLSCRQLWTCSKCHSRSSGSPGEAKQQAVTWKQQHRQKHCLQGDQHQSHPGAQGPLRVELRHLLPAELHLVVEWERDHSRCTDGCPQRPYPWS